MNNNVVSKELQEWLAGLPDKVMPYHGHLLEFPDRTVVSMADILAIKDINSFAQYGRWLPIIIGLEMRDRKDLLQIRIAVPFNLLPEVQETDDEKREDAEFDLLLRISNEINEKGMLEPLRSMIINIWNSYLNLHK